MDKFHDYANFVVDATSGNLPAYTFIEPAYDDDGQGTFANSQHPDFPVDRGEELIREIYSALTKSPDWKSTLFLILYDEHGGIFDHVSPPIITRNPIYNNLPDIEHSGPPDVFDFTRLGVRVPAVFVSPCIPPNTVINDQNYDHCSVVSTVRKLFCNPASQPLNWREAQAATFENVLTLTGANIRTDVVPLPDPPDSAGVNINAAAVAPIPRAPTDLSALMACAMQYSLQQQGLQPPGDCTTLTDSTQVSAYLKQAKQILQNAAGGGQ
jgi:phospholipase C